MRLAIWAWNPTGDDAPPLEIILELDKYEHKPLPSRNKDNWEILRSKVLPLTRARDFLKIITSFAGLVEPFSNPNFSLYYTLTRILPSEDSIPDSEPENAEQPILGKRTLYNGFRSQGAYDMSLHRGKRNRHFLIAITWIHFENTIGRS